jgi:hypothetical protein
MHLLVVMQRGCEMIIRVSQQTEALLARALTGRKCLRSCLWVVGDMG